MTDQSRLESLMERGVDLATGILIAWLTYQFVVPLLYPEYTPPPGPALGITLIFTASSFVRGYFWRRFFVNRVHVTVGRFIKARWYGPRKVKT